MLAASRNNGSAASLPEVDLVKLPSPISACASCALWPPWRNSTRACSYFDLASS